MASAIGAEDPGRWATRLGGAALLVWGASYLATKRPWLGAVVATSGAGLLWRSTSRIGDTRTALGGSRGTVVEESFTINRSPEDLYRFWRDLSRLPTVIPHLVSVYVIDDRQSHWIARGPAGFQTEWHADIINDIPNELIAWRTIEHSQVAIAGSIHFSARPHGRGTVVRVKLQYASAAGKLGAALAWASGDAPSQVIREGLRRFKQLMETGEIPTTEGQPRGAR